MSIGSIVELHMQVQDEKDIETGAWHVLLILLCLHSLRIDLVHSAPKLFSALDIATYTHSIVDAILNHFRVVLMCTHNIMPEDRFLDNISVLDYVCTVSRVSTRICQYSIY